MGLVTGLIDLIFGSHETKADQLAKRLVPKVEERISEYGDELVMRKFKGHLSERHPEWERDGPE